MNKVISGLVRTTAKGRIIALLVASLFVVALAFGACAGPTSVRTAAPAQAQSQAPAVEPARAAFKVSNLSISPAKVYPGELVSISATVKNTGGSDGEYIGGLKINNTIDDQKSVTLPAGAGKTLLFSTFRYESGVYTVSLDGQTTQFEVLAKDSPTQAASAASCCQQPNSSAAGQAGCCGGGASSTPITPGSPATPTTQRRGGCCGG